MFGTTRGFIPEPRQAEQPRHYVGRHRHAEANPARPADTGRDGTETDPDAPTRELASAAATAMTPEADTGTGTRP